MTPIIFKRKIRQLQIDKAIKTRANTYLIEPNDFERLTKRVVKFTEENKTKSVSKISITKTQVIVNSASITK
jgi:phosphopantothenoylcysteine synthetase/decarboxylase